nr:MULTISPECIES: rhodanese-like domain-containing protein [unclassified Streptomyces]
MARITAEEAHERTGPEAEAVLLDVREHAEWAAGHAPGAVHAPLSELARGARLPGAAEDRPVVTICRSGKRSQEAAGLLAARGADVVDVLGGMRAWVEAGLAVVGGSSGGRSAAESSAGANGGSGAPTGADGSPATDGHSDRPTGTDGTSGTSHAHSPAPDGPSPAPPRTPAAQAAVDAATRRA